MMSAGRQNFCEKYAVHSVIMMFVYEAILDYGMVRKVSANNFPYGAESGFAIF